MSDEGQRYFSIKCDVIKIVFVDFDVVEIGPIENYVESNKIKGNYCT